jgi:hypothetical protein
MNKLARPGIIAFSLLLLVGGGSVVSFGDHPEGATPADLRDLRIEVNRLDDSLRMLEPGHPREREFRQREHEMRLHQQDEREGKGASKSEVADLRRDIRDLNRDVDAAYDEVGASRSGPLDVPDGTQIKVRLEERVSSKTARVEDRVVGTVAEPVMRNGRTAIPAGTPILGTVERAERAERPSRGGRLEMSFDSLEVDGRRLGMDARVVKVSEGLDKSKAGLGALIGGVLGAVIDGKQGALIGAIVGGGGTVVASSGDDVELPAGSLLTVELERPLTLTRR